MRETPEYQRLEAARQGQAGWRQWGPYLSERAWGTVREDYSPGGTAWDYFPHDQARSRAYRWNEDGLAGVCDDQQILCFALALWNGHDPILKERLFGLTGSEGNHGEDVKEYYYYLDSTPTHSYMRMLYKYPQRAFPYADLVATNRRRGKEDPEYELIDTGAFADDRYFDVVVEYAKAAPDDLLIRVRATNRGPEAAELHLLPTLWFRNEWSWGDNSPRPSLRAADDGSPGVAAVHRELGAYRLACAGADELLFTENDTNTLRLFGVPGPSPYAKDAFDAYVVHGDRAAVNPARTGTKAAAHYRRVLEAGEETVLHLRLTSAAASAARQAEGDADAVFAARRAEADAFYAGLLPETADADSRLIQRQALAGLLWSKQFYHYEVWGWLDGDPGQPPPPAERERGRNSAWRHLHSAGIISMPDKWEYPWFAAWDLGFHCLPLAIVDPEFAKGQIDLLLSERFQHPSGQVPAYEWAFGDVNPPVLAWATWQVYLLERQYHGREDRAFLERSFHKLLLDFTWWVNRKDRGDNNLFEGGFLGLDNIGVFDRSAPLPDGSYIEQSDGTSWMAMYCLNLLTIALALSRADPVYERIANKFLEHFLDIAIAALNVGGDGTALWDDEDGFYYDVLNTGDGAHRSMKVRSFVGLIPLFAVATATPEILELLPRFRERLDTTVLARLERYVARHPDLTRRTEVLARWDDPGHGGRRLLALCPADRLRALLRRALDPEEFLSPHGLRALSRHHLDHPYVLRIDGSAHTVRYEPAESSTGMFGGNSNWRGPVWFPVNYLFIEALRHFHRFHGPDFTVECPVGSGRYLTLDAVADDLSRRLIGLFRRDASGRRPVFGGQETFQTDPHWRDHLLFYEYFHGDNGAGIGASHQTGWTALVALLIQQQAERAAPSAGLQPPRTAMVGTSSGGDP